MNFNEISYRISARSKYRNHFGKICNTFMDGIDAFLTWFKEMQK